MSEVNKTPDTNTLSGKIPKKKTTNTTKTTKTAKTNPLNKNISKKGNRKKTTNISKEVLLSPKTTTITKTITKTSVSTSTSVKEKNKEKFKIVSVYCHKGGNGKTEIAYAIARLAAKYGKRVLVIDLDRQCNFTSKVVKGGFEAYVKTLQEQIPGDSNNQDVASKLNDLFTFGKKLTVNPIRYSVDGSKNESFLDVIPGSINMNSIINQIAEELKNPNIPLNYAMGLRYLAEAYVKERGYDLVVFDLNPELSTLNTDALMCSDYCLVPCKLDDFSMQSFYTMYEGLFSDPFLMKRFSNRLKMLGFVPNMVQVGDDFQLNVNQKGKLEQFKTTFFKLFGSFCVDKELIYSTFFHFSKSETFKNLFSDIKDDHGEIRENQFVLFFKWFSDLIKL